MYPSTHTHTLSRPTPCERVNAWSVCTQVQVCDMRKCVFKLSSCMHVVFHMQGPLPTTVVHFWRMVLEHKVPAIVMLTNLVERGAAKCARYFPDQPGVCVCVYACRRAHVRGVCVCMHACAWCVCVCRACAWCVCVCVCVCVHACVSMVCVSCVCMVCVCVSMQCNVCGHA